MSCDSSHADISLHVDEYFACAARNGGRASPKVARRAWAAVRGPVGAAALTLARVGWRMSSAFTCTNSRGEEIGLTTTSPALFRMLLVDATRDAADRANGSEVGKR